MYINLINIKEFLVESRRFLYIIFNIKYNGFKNCQNSRKNSLEFELKKY